MKDRTTPPRPVRVPPSPDHHVHGGELHCERVPLARIAAEVGTPAYVYSGAAIDRAYREVDAAVAFAPHLVAYAVKANGNLAILARLGRAGCGADIVSGGELLRAREAGIPPERIVFSGVGKRDDELELALTTGIRSIHVESVEELDAVESIAARLGRVAPISLRVNPDVDAKTHPYIATGLHDSKFGLEVDTIRAILPRILASASVRLEGLACHIGSQLLSPEPLEEAVALTAAFAIECRKAGAPVRTVDAGGGWPMAYGDEGGPVPAASVFGDAIRRGLERAGALGAFDVAIEPGRALVGDAGVLLARVVFVKQRGDKRFVIVDAAMTELIRPALYEAEHAIVPVRAPATDAPWTPADVVGPVCETGDFLALDRSMPPLARGDLLAIRGAGAYGASMGSRYNARPLAAEVLVDGDAFRVIREREPAHEMWRFERI